MTLFAGDLDGTGAIAEKKAVQKQILPGFAQRVNHKFKMHQPAAQPWRNRSSFSWGFFRWTFAMTGL